MEDQAAVLLLDDPRKSMSLYYSNALRLKESLLPHLRAQTIRGACIILGAEPNRHVVMRSLSCGVVSCGSAAARLLSEGGLLMWSTAVLQLLGCLAGAVYWCCVSALCVSLCRERRENQNKGCLGTKKKGDCGYTPVF